MGMYDESWCASCGGHIEYTEDENAVCGECAHDEILLFMKKHKEQMEEELLEVKEFTETHDVLLGGIETLDYVLTKFGGY